MSINVATPPTTAFETQGYYFTEPIIPSDLGGNSYYTEHLDDEAFCPIIYKGG
jgi:hypothetical protein